MPVRATRDVRGGLEYFDPERKLADLLGRHGLAG